MNFTYMFQSRETVELIGAKVNSASIYQLVDSDYASELQNAFISGRKNRKKYLKIFLKIFLKISTQLTFMGLDPIDLRMITDRMVITRPAVQNDAQRLTFS